MQSEMARGRSGGGRSINNNFFFSFRDRFDLHYHHHRFCRLLTGFISSVSASTNQTKPKAFSVGFLLRPDKKTDGFFFPTVLLHTLRCTPDCLRRCHFSEWTWRRRTSRSKKSNKIRNRKKKTAAILIRNSRPKPSMGETLAMQVPGYTAPAT